MLSSSTKRLGRRSAEMVLTRLDIFAAYFNTLRWNCVRATDPRLFQSPFRAGIHIDAYQLEPLYKALRLPRVNLFIADDVGLDKTIEAGLIATELLLRHRVQDIVVSCPPSMLLQWRDELCISLRAVTSSLYPQTKNAFLAEASISFAKEQTQAAIGSIG
jgi:SNF2 family DNA or RNA helicase